jgi:hypothetical protein
MRNEEREQSVAKILLAPIRFIGRFHSFLVPHHSFLT